MTSTIKTIRKALIFILSLFFIFGIYKTGSTMLLLFSKGVNIIDVVTSFNLLKNIAIVVLYIVFLISQVPIVFNNIYTRNTLGITLSAIFTLNILYNYAYLLVIMMMYKSPTVAQMFNPFYVVLDIIEVAFLITYIVVTVKDKKQTIEAQ